MIPDRFFYPLAALLAGALVALALVYPQGQGARSPGRFGHAPELQTAQAQAALAQEADLNAKVKQAKKALQAPAQPSSAPPTAAPASPAP